MIVVYQGPDLDQVFVVKHFYGLDVRCMKGGIVNSETGTKAVWLKFGRTLRRFTVREAIRVHNLSVEDPLKIQLLDQGILCGEGKRLLQRHELYICIVSAKCNNCAGYWEYC